MLPTGTDFFTAFFGILYTGAVPVPIYPPMQLSQLEDYLRRQAGILRNAEARILVTVPEALRLAGLLRGLVPSLSAIESVGDLVTSPAQAALPTHQRSGRHRLDPVYVGQHRRSQRGRAQPRQPAGQHPRHHQGDRCDLRRRVAELASALSRHGTDRRLARAALFRGAMLHDVSAELPGPPAELAVGEPPLSRHRLGRAQLRVRALPQADRRCRPRGPRPELAALCGERRGAGEHPHAASFHRAVRPLRILARRPWPRSMAWPNAPSRSRCRRPAAAR